jgi:hypothetical protein
LYGNLIGAAGAIGLAEGLKNNSALETLRYDPVVALTSLMNVVFLLYSLYNNNVRDAGAMALGEGLKNNTALLSLS